MGTSCLSLKECESIIRGASQNYVKIGYALSLIRTYELYKEHECPTFESYVKRRFGYTDRWATHNIERMTVVALIFDLNTPDDFLKREDYFKDAYLSGIIASKMYRWKKTKQGLKDLYAKCVSYAMKKKKLSATYSDGSGPMCLRITAGDVDAVIGPPDAEIAQCHVANYDNTVRLLDKLSEKISRFEASDALEVAKACIKTVRDVVVSKAGIEFTDADKLQLIESIKAILMPQLI